MAIHVFSFTTSLSSGLETTSLVQGLGSFTVPRRQPTLRWLQSKNGGRLASLSLEVDVVSMLIGKTWCMLHSLFSPSLSSNPYSSSDLIHRGADTQQHSNR